MATPLVRTDSEGCVSPGCDEFSITSVDELPPSLRARYVPRLQVFPNPAPQRFTVEWPPGVAEDERLELGSLRLIDLQGRVVAEQAELRLPYEWQVGDVPTGQYLLEWRGENGSLAKGKVMIK
ncbi:MAG: T9SS type A sorting domain-containing protein [Bacteroidota bacterium]